ncbi:TPA: hypothetical protein JZG68_003660 [Escherichia coli]|nr:hypothetical protein [Escherichia coli]
MTTVTEIIGRVNTQLIDPLMVRWPLSELCDYYNDAVRAVILARPDAGASLETLNCVPGSRQTLPEGAIQLLDVICLSDGRAVKPLPREVLDAQYPDWQTQKGIPECFICSDLCPREFWLFPAPEEAISVDAVISRIPEKVNILTQDDVTPVPLEEAWVNPLVDWMLFRAFSKDIAGGAVQGLAAQHYQSFIQQLGIKQGADDALSVRKKIFNGGGV